MSMLLLRIWPALIPLIVYLVWLYYRKKKVGTDRQTPEISPFKGPLFWSLSASFVLLLVSFLVFGLTQEQRQEGTYIPPHYEGGKLSPARIEPE